MGNYETHYWEASFATSCGTKQPSITTSHNSLINTKQCPVCPHFLSCPIWYDIALKLKRRPVYKSICEPKANSCCRRGNEPGRLWCEEGGSFVPHISSFLPSQFILACLLFLAPTAFYLLPVQNKSQCMPFRGLATRRHSGCFQKPQSGIHKED